MLKTGDNVNTVCADWTFDNPMVVIEEDHLCGCGCGNYGIITCRGKSGHLYEEVFEAFELIK